MSDFPAHHFVSADQQREASELGMWVFLATEILFFGGLFLTYAVNRMLSPEAFLAASQKLDVVLGTINTLVLIASSLSMALAVHYVRLGKRGATISSLVATLIFGVLFLCVKGYEYHHKWVEGLIPTERFVWNGADVVHARMFFTFYFVMTGTHALHLLIGIGVLTVFIRKAWRGEVNEVVYHPVEVVGLYWHLIDVIWIFLFPLLYLIGLHV